MIFKKVNIFLFPLIIFLIVSRYSQTYKSSDYPYIFPFRHGEKYMLTQGFNGKLSHYGIDKYCLDFDMPKGTTICAARGGTVSYVKQDSDIGGPDPKYWKYANKIIIDHKDGTFGFYCHLRNNGALVKKGDTVKEGDEIGYSGSTGFSTGPHLHFSVFRYGLDGDLHSVEFNMTDYDGKIIVPTDANYYYSTHKGCAPFKIVLGRLIKASGLAKHHKPWKEDDKCDVYEEKIDSTIVLYFRNGKNKSVSVTLTGKVINMITTRKFPYTVTVPPKTEQFLMILRLDRPLEAWRYDYEFRYTEL